MPTDPMSPEEMRVFTVEVITEDKAAVEKEHASGWGENAQATVIHGKPMQIYVAVDGKPKFAFRLHDCGEITISDLAGGSFVMSVERHLTLIPLSNLTTPRQ